MIGIESNIQGPLEAMAALRQSYPGAIDAAIRMEAVNIQRSVAATIRNLRVKKYRFAGLNSRGNETWESIQLAKLDPTTQALRRRTDVPTPGGVLGLDRSVTITVDAGGITIGHKGRMADYIRRWQNGIPQPPRQSPEDRHRWYATILPRLASATGRSIKTEEERKQYLASIPDQSPERAFYDALAEVVNRDFPAGLGTVLGKILGGEIRKADRAEIKAANRGWRRSA